MTVVLVPLLWEVLPDPQAGVRAFVSPAEVAPPPPPPPPAAGARPAPKAPVPARPPERAAFTAPVEVPNQIAPEGTMDLGVEGGVPGGVEGGVPGGVVGGIVGGLPEAPAPPPQVVRVGGWITAPRLVRQVSPVYPDLAIKARASAIVILEAQVDVGGYVKSVTVLRGSPLFDEAAVAAVKQWRYQPLLLNGQPTEFILTVTVRFDLQSVGQEGQP